MNRKFSVLLCLIAFTVLLNASPVPSVQGIVYEQYEVFYSTSSDGQVRNTGYVYQTVWNASSGDSIGNTSDVLIVENHVSGGLYCIFRCFLFFNTSSLPDNATILSATLSLHGILGYDYSEVDFNITVQNGQPTYPHDPLVLGDFARGNYSGNGGFLDTSDFLDWTYNDIELNNTGIGWINNTATTKLCLRSSREIAGIAPTEGEYEFVYVWASEKGQDYAPKLTVVYNAFTFHGVYDEDTGLLNPNATRAVNVTAYFTGGKSSETFEVNGTYTYCPTAVPLYFKFDLTNPREFWVSDDVIVTFYIFDTSTTVYTISFLDLAGLSDDWPFVEAKRYINGTLRTIERRKIDEQDKVVMALKNGAKYTIVLRDSGSHTFGDLTMTSDTTVDLTLKGLEFPDNIVLTYKYVRIYADRGFGASGIGNITITYQDLLNKTTQVFIYIKYNNHTVANEGGDGWNSTNNSFQYVWSSAVNTTDYYAVAEINHQQFGVLTEKWYLPRGFSEAPWGLDILGTLPFDTSVLIPFGIILFVAGVFSALTFPVGAILVTTTATLLNYLGWVNIDVPVLVAAWAFSIIMALIWAKRKVAT